MFIGSAAEGGALRIAAGADLELPAIVFEGTGRLSAHRRARRAAASSAISALAGRAALARRTGPSCSISAPARFTSRALTWSSPISRILRTDRLAAAGLLPGTELTHDRLHGHPGRQPTRGGSVRRSTRVAAPALTASGGTSGQSAVIRVRDCFLRSGGEGFAVAAGRRLDLELSNVLVSTEGSLLHAFGGVRPGRADSPAVKFHLDQVTARVKGGLVHLDSTPEEPELPFATILAENSILSTANRDDPLFRLDGRDQLDDLGNKIRWEAEKSLTTGSRPTAAMKS